MLYEYQTEQLKDASLTSIFIDRIGLALCQCQRYPLQVPLCTYYGDVKDVSLIPTDFQLTVCMVYRRGRTSCNNHDRVHANRQQLV